jgi:hypothetical protein
MVGSLDLQLAATAEFPVYGNLEMIVLQPMHVSN